jgi:hypothetical protein
MIQTTERVFELHWRQLGQDRWQAVLIDPETRLQYRVASKLAFRTVLANLTAAARRREPNETLADDSAPA